MGKVISKIEIAVIIPDEPPLEYLVEWVKSMKESAPEMAQALRKAIPNLEAYLKKIVYPGIDEMKGSLEKPGWLNPDYRTKHGRTRVNIINTAEKNFHEGYKRLRKKIKQLFEAVDGESAKRYSETLEYRAYHACLRTAQLNLPFTGYHDEIRGVGPFAARWLSGDETAKAQICDLDKVLVNGPVLITKPERAGEFRNELIHRISQSGSRIVKAMYDPEVIRPENNQTNELVNQFLSDGFAKFTTGGESSRLGRDGVYPEERRAVASHLDFIVENGLLYLDIQVSQI